MYSYDRFFGKTFSLFIVIESSWSISESKRKLQTTSKNAIDITFNIKILIRVRYK